MQHIPLTTLAPIVRTYLLSSFKHNQTLDPSEPPELVLTIRMLRKIGLTDLLERELSSVVAEKVREFIYIEAKGDWKRRYTSLITEWVDGDFAELLRFILGRNEGESVGQNALKTIALRALTELRYECWSRLLMIGLMSYLISSRSFLTLLLELRISRYLHPHKPQFTKVLYQRATPTRHSGQSIPSSVLPLESPLTIAAPNVFSTQEQTQSRL
jgi:hypothetical protein